MLEVILDTNVLISGLLKNSSTKIIIDALIDEKFALNISPKLFEELLITLEKPRLSPIINSLDRNILIALIKSRSRLVTPSLRINDCRDPKDNMVLEAAVAAKANFLVTGDKDLLVLKKIKKTAIIAPKEFITLLKKR